MNDTPINLKIIIPAGDGIFGAPLAFLAQLLKVSKRIDLVRKLKIKLCAQHIHIHTHNIQNLSPADAALPPPCLVQCPLICLWPGGLSLLPAVHVCHRNRRSMSFHRDVFVQMRSIDLRRTPMAWGRMDNFCWTEEEHDKDIPVRCVNCPKAHCRHHELCTCSFRCVGRREGHGGQTTDRRHSPHCHQPSPPAACQRFLRHLTPSGHPRLGAAGVCTETPARGRPS